MRCNKGLGRSAARRSRLDTEKIVDAEMAKRISPRNIRRMNHVPSGRPRKVVITRQDLPVLFRNATARRVRKLAAKLREVRRFAQRESL